MLPLSILLFAAAATDASAPVIVEYREKPPYNYTEAGIPKGFLVDRVRDIFGSAKVEMRFEAVPANRLMADIEANTRPVCSPGYYRLPERERFARFTAAMYVDKPHALIANHLQASSIRHLGTLKALLASSQYTMGVVDGVSYGAELDAAIGRLPRAPMRAAVPPGQLVKMVGAGRADFMLIDEEDLQFLGSSGQLAVLGVERVQFPDPPAGLRRHIMCSRAVSAETIRRLDAAIQKLYPSLR
ncbi:MAG: transporter substrate-binding domain-containing protein [Burkholderiales bacterium]|nr:transporter substrate-binding domain-containing protein [Burkholderiales bacterium]